jgi:hypothetical protein
MLISGVVTASSAIAIRWMNILMRHLSSEKTTNGEESIGSPTAVSYSRRR